MFFFCSLSMASRKKQSVAQGCNINNTNFNNNYNKTKATKHFEIPPRLLQTKTKAISTTRTSKTNQQ